VKRFRLFDVLDHNITQERIPSFRHPHLYPSEASVIDADGVIHGRCLRQVYYRLTNTQKTNPENARAMWIFQMGLLVEAAIIEQCKQAGIWYDDHVKWYNPEFNLSGELDVVIRNPEEPDMLIGVECCTPATTFLTSDYRVVSFEELNGAGIIGHTGQPNQIVNFQEHWVEDEPVYRFRGKFDGLFAEFTGEHPVLVGQVKMQRKGYNHKLKQAFPRRYEALDICEWKKASEVKRGDYLCIPKADFSYTKNHYIFSEVVIDWPHLIINDQVHPVNKAGNSGVRNGITIPSEIPISADLYWLLGLYLAEGSCTQSTVYFSLHEDKTEIINKVCRIIKGIFGLEAKVRSLKNAKCVNVSISSRAFREFIKAIIPGNTLSRTKRLRYDLIAHQYLNSMLDGICQGDGTTNKKSGTQERVSTAVPSLAYLYFQLAAHCGGHPNIKKHRQQSQFNSDYIYVVSWSFNQTKRNIARLIDGGSHWLYKVKQVDTRLYTGPVNNMETSPDNSYVAGMISVHNCKSFYGYYAGAQIMGTRTQPGFPKMDQLLQTFLYVDWFKEMIQGFKMAYMERGSMDRRDFDIEYQEVDNGGGRLIYPIVNGQTFPKFSLNGIYDRYRQVWEHFQQREIPNRDYRLYYSKEEMAARIEQGLASQVNAKGFKRHPDRLKYRKADWQCSYCGFCNLCWNVSALDNQDVKDLGLGTETPEVDEQEVAV